METQINVTYDDQRWIIKRGDEKHYWAFKSIQNFIFDDHLKKLTGNCEH